MSDVFSALQPFANYQSVIQLSVAVNSALVAVFLVFESEKNSVESKVKSFEETIERATPVLGAENVPLTTLGGIVIMARAALPDSNPGWIRVTKTLAIIVALISVPLLLAASIFADATLPRVVAALLSIFLLAPIFSAIVLVLLIGQRLHQVDSTTIATGLVLQGAVQQAMTPRKPDQGDAPAPA